MLGELFQKILDMSLIGCYSILIVMAVRALLLRFERKFTYYLWFVVFLNLCIPLSFHGVFSLIPGFVAEFSVSDAIEDVLGSHVQSGPDTVTIPAMSDIAANIDNHYNSALGNTGDAGYPSKALGKETTTPLAIKTASGVWLAGIAVLFIWSLAGMLRLKNKVSRDNWICFNRKQGIAVVSEIDTPFLWGILNPTIYLPTDLEPEEMQYIVAHEQYHKKRKDYLVKIAVFLVVAIHWFNPLVWAAYTLFCKDMEISCDEAVLLEFKENIRKQYAGSLLKYAARQSGFVLSPITFGEPAVKTRIKNVLHFRKRGIVISALAVICVVAVAAGLVLRPFAEERMPQEVPGQNTSESDLLDLNVGMDNMFGLSTEETNDISDLAAAAGTGEGRETSTILTIMQEGMPEEIPATLYVGEGYSFYLTDGDWSNYEPDAWQAEKNDQVHFGVAYYEGMNKSQVERTLTEQGYAVENGELWMQDSDIIYRTICYETESGAWTVNFAYPWGEAEEGWLPVMRAMADTFSVDAGYNVGAHMEKAVMPEGAGINDGEIFAYIIDSDADIISIDEIEWVTVPGSRADELGITQEDGPSGFYIYNPDTMIKQFTLSADCMITILDWQNSFEPQTISVDDFIAVLQERGEQNAFIPYILEIANGEIIKISERYVP